MASSTFPLASTSAFLQSSRPAPVWTRSAFTIWAVMGSLMLFRLDRGLAGAGELPLGTELRVHEGEVNRDVDLRQVDLTSDRRRRRLGGGLGRSLCIGAALRAPRVALGEAGLNRGDDRLHDDSHGLDGVVVAGNRVGHKRRVRIRVHQRYRGDRA